jgi:hypothetical protein
MEGDLPRKNAEGHGKLQHSSSVLLFSHENDSREKSVLRGVREFLSVLPRPSVAGHTVSSTARSNTTLFPQTVP